jgi:hypothetical protein
MGFRVGALIGALATAVVALAVAVILLATDDDSDDDVTTPTPTAETVLTPETERCLVAHAGGKARIDARASGLTCAEATRIYTAYQEQVEAGNAADIDQTAQIQGWECKTHPFAEYPLLVRCQAGEQRIDVLGLAPSAHPGQAPSAAPQPPGGEVTFQTPSGNIGCLVTTEHALCGIREFTYSPPPQPADCDLPGWGHTIGVEATGSGDFVCADSLLAGPDAQVLAYGRGVLVGPFACGSSSDGLTCANRDTRHGFFISRDQARTF